MTNRAAWFGRWSVGRALNGSAGRIVTGIFNRRLGLLAPVNQNHSFSKAFSVKD